MMARSPRKSRGKFRLPNFIACFAPLLAAIFIFGGCHGGTSTGTGAINITLIPTGTVSMDAQQVTSFTATVDNDATNKGVTWQVFNDASTNPPSCTIPSCGTLSNSTPFTVTYTAPGNIAAQVSVTLEATSVANTNITKTATLTIDVAMMFTTMNLPGGENGVPYNQKIAVTGGVAPLSFTAVSGSLPAGLSLGLDGMIAGTPSGSGTSQFTVQVADGATPPATLTEVLSITIAPAQPISITTTSLPEGVVGFPYNASISSVGGIPPLTWSLIGGALPAGLTLSTITTTSGSPPTTMTLGEISGTPLSAGTTSFTVEVEDSAIPPQTATQTLSLTINPPVPLKITTQSLPGGTTAAPYNEAVQSTGGVAPITWSIVQGLLPPGLALNPSSGTISGTPSRTGSSTFTIEAIDSESTPETATMTYTVAVVANSNIILNNQLVAGPFAFLFRGFGKASTSPEFPEILTGVFTADGKGTISAGVLDIHSNALKLSQSFTGAYSMGSDGRGSMTWSVPGPGNTTLTLVFQLALDAEGNLTFVELDNTGGRGAGIILQQSSTSFTPGVFSGDYTFLLPGFDTSNKPSVMAGRMHSDGSSLISEASADVNDAGIPTSFPSITGSFSNISANGRGTMSLFLSPATDSLIIYLVNPNEVIFLSTQMSTTSTKGIVTTTNLPPFAGIARSESGEPFSNVSLNGSYVVTGSGIDSNGNGDVFGSLMQFTPSSSSGTFTPQTFDQNDGGSISTTLPAAGQFTVQTNGRFTLTGSFNRLRIGYLVSPSEAVFVGTDGAGTGGRIELQTAPSFSAASIQGQFTLGSPFLGDSGSTTLSGVASADGISAITGTTDSEVGTTQAMGAALAATYTVASNGRGIATPASGAGLPASLAMYITSPTSARLVSIDPTDTHPEIFLFDY